MICWFRFSWTHTNQRCYDFVVEGDAVIVAAAENCLDCGCLDRLVWLLWSSCMKFMMWLCDQCIYSHYNPLQIHYNPLQIHYKLTTLTTNSLQIHYKLTTTHYKLTTLENVVSGVSRKLNGRSPISFLFLRNVIYGTPLKREYPESSRKRLLGGEWFPSKWPRVVHTNSYVDKFKYNRGKWIKEGVDEKAENTTPKFMSSPHLDRQELLQLWRNYDEYWRHRDVYFVPRSMHNGVTLPPCIQIFQK